MTFVGQIEGHYTVGEGQKATKYESVLPELVEINTDPSIKGLLILLNTVGGDVEAGLAIAEMIASMDKPTVSLVLGGGHSIGVPLAVSAKRSFIVPSATMTVHPVRISGTVIGAPQTFYYFNRMQDRILKFVTEHSNIKAERLRELMMKTDEIATDIGSIIDGYQAVEEGIIDSVGGLSEALKGLFELSEGNFVK
jgi:ATP-dependent protease ClpP protease subunit